MAGEASPWVEKWINGVPAGGAVLDVACGLGRHTALARRLGHKATAVDLDVGAARFRFASDPDVTIVEADLESESAFPFGPHSFDGVVVTNYLWRPILPAIVAAVRPGGVLIYETFRAGNEKYGKPSNPDFLLKAGELAEAVHGKLAVIAYEDVLLAGPPRCVQRICAVGPDHRWVAEPPPNAPLAMPSVPPAADPIAEPGRA